VAHPARWIHNWCHTLPGRKHYCPVVGRHCHSMFPIWLDDQESKHRHIELKLGSQTVDGKSWNPCWIDPLKLHEDKYNKQVVYMFESGPRCCDRTMRSLDHWLDCCHLLPLGISGVVCIWLIWLVWPYSKDPSIVS
jgi:hypothetical protein